MSTVIKVENLSKRYRLGVINRDMLYRDLQSRWAKFRGKEDPNERVGLTHDQRLEHGDEFWALRNVDLEVKEGEILGIIGRNGAGKSTLLKILSLITAPTEGRIKVKGRIASLLEVGTGFHPELTGRENVFLNGAILGMTRKEVRSKFDEIVDFADIDDFIDTPVKRYSSGMYVRLAFAVAAHLEPEILIVDEVLAVGDMDFQKRCLGRMDEVARNGRTVLFVSHSMPMISSLCSRCLLLESGRPVADGPVPDVLRRYQTGSESCTATVSFGLGRRCPGDEYVSLVELSLANAEEKPASSFRLEDSITIKITFNILRSLSRSAQPNISIFDESGSCAFASSPYDWDFGPVKPGCYTAFCTIPPHLLNDGLFSISVALNHFEKGLVTACFEKHTLAFNVVDKITDSPYREAIGWAGRIPGVVRPMLKWDVKARS